MANFHYQLTTVRNFLKERSAYFDSVQKSRMGNREIIEEGQVKNDYLNVFIILIIYYFRMKKLKIYLKNFKLY